MSSLRIRAARRAAHAVIANGTSGGRLEIAEGSSVLLAGDPSAELAARVEVRDPRAWPALIRGSHGMGEGYAAGWWDTGELVDVIRIAARSLGRADRLRAFAHPLTGRIQSMLDRVPRNTHEGARRNISAHYDLGNDLFQSFLDERMMYSSAYFPEPGASLEAAQVAKLERICDRLQLDASDHLLEIGTGWGGLAVYAASTRGCKVTTTTISREQRDHARALVAQKGLQDLVEVVDRDYRELSGRFDKLVSIEMIEAVGWQYLDVFFQTCSDLLTEEGLMFLQAIVIDDRLYEHEKAAKSFANTSVFPGGCLPSMSVIAEQVRSNTRMRWLWAEEIGPHYAQTLRIWRERFEAAWPKLRDENYDERFRRLWRFYLAFCEAGFRERRIGDVQLVLAKPAYRGDDLANSAPVVRLTAQA
jgi:cyclopropane-fatty-acyl-phospholipid synthase